MNLDKMAKGLWFPLAMVTLYVTVAMFRPLFPVDETRYMTVAWEMYLRHDWLEPLTVNFSPYHHKPPLLFWLINGFWSVFGVSRWAGLIPVVLSPLICAYLTVSLSKHIFPDKIDAQRILLIFAGSVPFLVYGTLVMFDFTLCLFVLLSLILLLLFKKMDLWRFMILMGVSLGLGVLTKGPVAYLYVLPAAFLAPFWAKENLNIKRWYLGIAIAILTSIIPVLIWLVPIIKQSDGDFAFWLVWNQTAGRITGNFNAAHVRPFWFYLPLLPAFMLPWILFPSFWRRIAQMKSSFQANEGVRFLVMWLVPVFFAFTAISGKQPHYLVPLLPGLALISAYCLRAVETKRIAMVAGLFFCLVVSGHLIAHNTIFKKYDLRPITEIIEAQPDRPLAFVRSYQGEVGFLAKRKVAVDDLDLDQIDVWFDKHPDGWAIVRFNKDDSVLQKYKEIISYSYRGKNLGIFER